MYPQHEHISRVSFLVCLSVFACTLVHSNSPTTSTDSLACFAGALTKQLSDLPLSKTCVAHVSDIVIEYTRIPQWQRSRVASMDYSAEPAANLQTLRRFLKYLLSTSLSITDLRICGSMRRGWPTVGPLDRRPGKVHPDGLSPVKLWAPFEVGVNSSDLLVGVTRARRVLQGWLRFNGAGPKRKRRNFIGSTVDRSSFGQLCWVHCGSVKKIQSVTLTPLIEERK